MLTRPFLLDTTTARLGGLTLKDGGRLVFSPSDDGVKLISDFVLIEDGGSLEIGSATCFFENEAEIVLTGELVMLHELHTYNSIRVVLRFTC